MRIFSDAMFRDQWKPLVDDGIKPLVNGNEERPGSTFKLNVNCFRIIWNPSSSIYHYHYDLSGEAAANAATDPKAERKLLERAWSDLEKKLETFCFRAPGHIFSPKKVDDFTIFCPAKDALQEFTMTVSVREASRNATGVAEVVGQHIVNQLATRQALARKVGRRLYKESQTVVEAGKGSLNMMYSLSLLKSSYGPLLQVDLMHRPVQEKTIIDVLKGVMPGMDIFAYRLDNEIKIEWLECCVSATVVTSYNNRVYRIKSVHFDMDPNSFFDMRRKGDKDLKISLWQYLKLCYSREVKFKTQPVLEAFPDKSTERVFLLPEFCHLTGLDEDTSHHKTRLMETLKRLKASPQERYDAILQGVAKEFKDQDICKKWGCQLEVEPLKVEGRILEKWQVSFEEQKKFAVDEEGTFSRWLRHGLQDARTIEDWLLIYPAMDEPVLELWISSLRSTAESGFNMKLGDPHQLCCSDQRSELPTLLQTHVTSQTQFVVLLTPPNESWKVYRTFKDWMCCRMPTPCQVIKSDTIRKRQSTGAILARIVQQMNAKSWGPLWHIHPEEAETPIFEEFLSKPAMVLGINIYQTSSERRWIGLVASLNKAFSQYYSMAKECTDKGSLSTQLQQLFRDALVAFAEENDGLLPQRFVVYQAFISPDEWPMVEEVEFKSLQAVLDMAKKKPAADGPTYAPEMTYIVVSKKDDMRIFTLRPDAANIANPESGTVVNDPRVSSGPFPNFYAVNQSCTRGTAVPAHFTVLKQPEKGVSMDFVEALTYRLSLLYYNSNAAVRLPAPAMYACRLSHFVGTALQQEPSTELSKTLFYL